MHLIEQYALASSSKIGKPHILTKYFPLNIDKYITFHFSSKGAKTYDYADEVVNLLIPILSKENIKIIQIGAVNERPINGCIHLMGQTNLGQIAYLIQNSLLHCGVDSFPVHIASSFDKKIVSLYSSNHTNCVKPYWGNPENQILLEPNRIKYKPSFSMDESPKSIHQIFPEVIAKSICKLLGFDFSYPFKTISIGYFFNQKVLESAVTDVIDIKKLGAQNLILNLTINNNYLILQQQLQICPCQLICDIPIPVEILKQFRPNILGVIYEITEQHNPAFVKTLIENKIPYQLISKLSIDKLNPIKLSYLDYNPIQMISSEIPKELKDKDLSKVFFKTGKLLLAGGKFYSSLYEYVNANPILNPMKVEPHQINLNNIELLWPDAAHCMFSEKA